METSQIIYTFSVILHVNIFKYSSISIWGAPNYINPLLGTFTVAYWKIIIMTAGCNDISIDRRTEGVFI